MCLLVFGYTFQLQGTIFRIILMCIPQIPEIRRRSVLLLSNNIFQFKLILERFAKRSKNLRLICVFFCDPDNYRLYINLIIFISIEIKWDVVYYIAISCSSSAHVQSSVTKSLALTGRIIYKLTTNTSLAFTKDI